MWPDCGGGAEVGAGYGRWLSLPRASWMEGKDWRPLGFSLSSSRIRPDSGGEM